MKIHFNTHTEDRTTESMYIYLQTGQRHMFQTPEQDHLAVVVLGLIASCVEKYDINILSYQ